MLELQAYLAGETRVPGVDAIPGKGSRVPLYILGSSMFGATLAAALGLPYAFASHFAPQMLEAAVAAYRREFRPSEQLDRPYVIAGVNVLAADTTAQAQEQLQAVAPVPGRPPCSAAGRRSPTSRPTSCWPRARRSTSTRCSPTPPSARRPRSATTSTAS